MRSLISLAHILFSLDREAAKKSPFGALLESGRYTASITMQLLVEHHLLELSSLGVPGTDEFRWLLPFCAGDELTARVIIFDVGRFRSRRDQGIVRSKTEMLNQDWDALIRLTATTFVRCENPTDAG